MIDLNAINYNYEFVGCCAFMRLHIFTILFSCREAVQNINLFLTNAHAHANRYSRFHRTNKKKKNKIIYLFSLFSLIFAIDAVFRIWQIIHALQKILPERNYRIQYHWLYMVSFSIKHIHIEFYYWLLFTLD